MPCKYIYVSTNCPIRIGNISKGTHLGEFLQRMFNISKTQEPFMIAHCPSCRWRKIFGKLTQLPTVDNDSTLNCLVCDKAYITYSVV